MSHISNKFINGNTALLLTETKSLSAAFLEVGTDYVKQTELNMTAIMIAAKRGHEEVLATLLESPNGRRINDKERACCIGVPAILKSQRCVSLMLVDFNPFKVELGQEVVAGNGGDGCVGSGSEGDVIVIATPESGIQSKSASVFISSDMERIIKEHDLMLNGLQNLSHVMSEHIKSLINIHHTTTATVSINTTTDKDKDKAVNDVPVKRNSGVFFGSKKIHPAATEPAAMNRQTNGNGNDSNNTTTNDSSLSTSLTSNGWGALLQAQNMVADLRALITGSGTSTSTGSRSQQFSGGDLGREIDSAAILLHGKELYEKSHDILSSGHHYMSLDSLSKTLLWRGEMKTLDGNISTETFYKVKLKQGMEIRIDDINSSLTLVISESIQMKVVIKEDIHRSDWLEALKNATCT
eukprot:gene4217-8391_t